MAQTADSENRNGFYHGPATTSIAFSRDLLQKLMMDKCSHDNGLIGKEESDDDMELNLGLSLGGCHVRKVKKEKSSDLHRKDGGGDFGLQRDGGGDGNGNFGLHKSDEGGVVEFGFGLEEEDVPKIQEPPRHTSQEMLEQQKKRELHALRRQEAKKKREEKQLQRARREAGMRSIQPNKVGRNGFVPLAPTYAAAHSFTVRGGSSNLTPMTRIGSLPSEEDKRLLGTQMASIKEKHRVVKENEPCRSDRKQKASSKASDQGDTSGEDKNSRTSHETDNMVSSSNVAGDPPASNEVSSPERSHPAYPVLPMSYPFPVIAGNPQCMPLPMGFSFPYMMPFWPAAPTGPEGSKSTMGTPPLPANVLQPIPTRPFPPFQIPVSGTSQTSWFAGGPAHSSHASGASSGRSSSAVSDYESKSSPGASSNDTKSQSSTSSAVELLQRVSSVSKTQDQTVEPSEVSTANHIESPPKSAEVVALEKVPSNAAQSVLATSTTASTIMQEKQVSEASKVLQQGCPSNPQPINSNNTKTTEDDQAHEGDQSSLLKMPFVSTTGEGGKTINGFLYSYRGGEVSIVCVCHGTFLSPAEFVQHAGRKDISHPERHIVVSTSLCAMQDAPAMG